jgi:hypothetical protein
MSLDDGVTLGLTERRHSAAMARSVALRLVPWLALAALFAAAIALRHGLAANTDVSWLLTVAERVLNGQRLYVDVIETNPPMAVLIYIPGVLIARAIGWSPEIVTDALVFVAIFTSLAVTSRILKNSRVLESRTRWPLALLTFAVLALLPAKTFGQREHIALIELLPALALYVVRARSEPAPRWAIVLAGAGMGLAMAFKPYFAIGIFCGVAALAIRSRSWRILLAPENFISAAIVAIYGGCVVVFYPDFFSFIAPLMRDVYIRVGASPLEMLKTPAVPIWVALMFASFLLKRRGRIDGALLLLLMTSLGFMLAFLLQRKGWPYHSYPMIAFAMLGLGCALAMRRPFDRALGAFALATLAITFVQSMLWFNWAFDKAFDARPLWAAVADLGPHPKILAITGEPGLGHPMVRALGGTWVSRQQGLWVAGYLHVIRQASALDPQTEAALDRHAARERAMLIEDIDNNPPTVVLVDNFSDNWSKWLETHPDIADRLRDYRLVSTIDDIEVRAKLR